MRKHITLLVFLSLIGSLYIWKNFQGSSDKEVPLSAKKGHSARSNPKIGTLDESLIPEEDVYANIPAYERFKDAYRVSLYEKLEALSFEEAYQSVFDNQKKFEDPLDFEVFLKAVLKRWGKYEPDRVLELITGDLPLSKQEMPALLQSVAIGFAKQDSHAAFEWLEAAEKAGLIEDAATGDRIYTRILQVHASEHPEEVLEIFHELETESTQFYVISPLLEQLTKTDFTAATNLVLSIPKGPVREKAMENIIKYNNANPKFLVDTFLANQNFVSKGEIAESLDKLAESNFQVAKKTLLEAEGAGQNEFILTRFASSQALVDGERLHSLVEEITDPKLRDNVIGNIANSYTTTNLGIGISVAADIKNANQRIQTISQIIQKGSDEQIQGFHDYFDEFPEMPAAEKAIYLEQLNERLTNIEGD